MVKPPLRDLDEAVEESMGMFSRAKVSSVAPVDPRRPGHVLLALDGSSQDPLGTAIARQFQERFDSAVSVVDARENVPSNEFAARIASSMDANALPKTAGDSFEQILTAVGESQCDLLITPCPYGRDLETVGPNSAGTVIDVLLARSPVPILVVRKPYEPQGDLFRRVLMILTAENEAAPAAASWAAGLIAARGVLRLVLVLEREMYQNIHALMESIAPDVDVSTTSLSQALAQTHMRLHRSLQKTAAEHGFEHKLKLQVEGEAGSLTVEDERSHPLIVLALERSDHASQGSVQSRIRLSPNPILVVCKD